ncbi:hypothetical protein NE237_015654 [Protea cynaroides]|uniref:Uncharacterized protein n=1 Tax=Protea cynaroides TaxID=273540 RepID=A0A9Q0QR99_9MAGN|nr:hypothetical protein NE237_015654 [Protea cynaroides]
MKKKKKTLTHSYNLRRPLRTSPVKTLEISACIREQRQVQAIISELTLLNRYYSINGHAEKLAEEIKKGASSMDAVEAKLWQVYDVTKFLYDHSCGDEILLSTTGVKSSFVAI